jgi:hypothetical protein
MTIAAIDSSVPRRVEVGAPRAGLCALLVLLGLATAESAEAQDAGGAAADQSASADEEIILDPELSGVAPPPTAASSEAASPPAEPNGEIRAQLHSRIAMDLGQNAPREDLWELMNVALFEARVRRSESLRFAVGLRIRHLFALRRNDTPDADADRTTLDVTPTAGYGDVTIADGLHLRLGYQGVRLGSFELLNASDVLSVYDLRSGPTTFPEAAEIAQLAARMDWDASSWLSLTLIGVPFFQPHRVSVLDGNYALYPNGEILGAEAGSDQDELRRTLSRSGQARLADETFAAFAPEPNLERPQAALHMTAHGAVGELRLTAALARDQNFSVRTDPTPGIEFAPFGLFSLDGTIGVGPLQLGAELAYMLERTVYTSGFTSSGDTTGLAERTDVGHLGIRLEHAQGESLGFVVEATASRMFEPRGRSGPWLWTVDGRWFFATAGVAWVAFGDFSFELAGSVINGPTYFFTPRLEAAVAEGLYLELGAHIVGAIPRPAGYVGYVLGDVYETADQIFLGARWVM